MEVLIFWKYTGSFGLANKLRKYTTILVINYYLPGPGMSLFFTKSDLLLFPKEKPFLDFKILVASPFIVI
jgi:hypothetical protein